MSRYAQQEATEKPTQSKPSRSSGSFRLLRATSLSLRWLIMLALSIALLTTRYADAIVWAFGGPEFLPESGFALKILIWFLPFSFINSLLQYVLIGANRQHSLTRAYLIALLFNVIANFFAIQYFGLCGATGVTILSEIMLLLPFYKLIRESVDNLSWPMLFSKPLIALILAAQCRVNSAVMMQESAGHPTVCSSAGACGLMQLMPGTAINVQDRMNPTQRGAVTTISLQLSKSTNQGHSRVMELGWYISILDSF